MKFYALYEKVGQNGYYITFDPVQNKYKRCKSKDDLKIWDVLDEEMIPYIVEETDFRMMHAFEKVEELKVFKSKYEFKLLDDITLEQLEKNWKSAQKLDPKIQIK
ncbi:MAG: hypothetical protein AAF620_00035 [Bacteroidota bacterium]